MLLRTLKILPFLLVLWLPAAAQSVMRSEIAPYALRKEADDRIHSESDLYNKFAPTLVAANRYEQSLEVSQSWVDAVATLHLEAVGSAYSLWINGRRVATCEDSFTPSDYNISPHLKVGSNVITVTTHESAVAQIESSLAASKRALFDGSYISTQRRLRILDYALTMTEHTNGEHGQLLIDVVVENRFNSEESLEVGFDIYDPTGKLLDFSTREISVAPLSVDTVHFAPHLYGAQKYRWNPKAVMAMRQIGRPSVQAADEPIYSLMLFTRRNRISSDYIPLTVAFTLPEYEDGVLSAWGEKITLKAVSYNALSSQEQSESELRMLRQQGYNTIEPDYPQPIWFYSLCDKIGLYVIDRAAINAPQSADDRTVGGTASNDPGLKDEYLERVQKMYYRSRNFSCVVAYSLGGDSGNGYNMYKAYQWLKGVEQRRPIIYQGADGEWNSDLLTIER